MSAQEIFSHHNLGHDVGYVEVGRDYRKLYVEGFNIEVGKSEDYHMMDNSVMCYTCNKKIGDSGDVTDWV